MHCMCGVYILCARACVCVCVCVFIIICSDFWVLYRILCRLFHSPYYYYYYSFQRVLSSYISSSETLGRNRTTSPVSGFHYFNNNMEKYVTCMFKTTKAFEPLACFDSLLVPESAPLTSAKPQAAKTPPTCVCTGWLLVIALLAML